VANQKILDQKALVVNEITDKVKNAATFVVFNNNGLNVAELTELRRQLKESGSEVKIYKNTLVKRALKPLNIELDDEFNGPKAIAFGTDALAPIKVVNDFAKDHPALEIKVGYTDGEIIDTKKLAALASVPGRQELLTMLAGALMGQVRNLSIALNMYQEKLEK
jgi:large subunit ribosomal protein L10